MNDEFEQAQKRAIRYWHIDGLVELSFSAIFSVLGLYFYFQGTLPKESALYKILDMSMVILIFTGFFLGQRILAFLKQRITYPRTGYVSYRRPQGKGRLLQAIFAGSLGLLTSLLLGFLFAGAPSSFAWMPAVTGIIMAAIFAFIALRYNLFRYYFLSALTLIWGGGLSVTGVGDILGLGIFYLGIALASALAGALILAGYLRNTKPPAEAFNE